MDIVAAQDPWLLEWAGARLRASWEPERVRWISGVSAGAPVFVVVYSRFGDGNCELTIATDGTRRWATRRSLRAIFSVPFRQWGLRRVTFMVRADNAASLDLCERLGAVREGVVREAFPDGEAGVLLGMLRKECTWC